MYIICELESVKEKKKKDTIMSAYKPSGPSGRSLSRFLLPPGQDAAPSQDPTPVLRLLVPTYTPVWKEAQ